MKKVLFVCLGNICRSTMAEGILTHKIKERGLQDKISCFSVGTAGYHIGVKPDHRTMQVLEENRIEYEHYGTQLEPHHLKTYDFVFAMDESNLKNIQKMEEGSGVEANAILFRKKYGDGINPEVPDPYYGGDEGFLEVYEMLDACCTRFLDEIKL